MQFSVLRTQQVTGHLRRLVLGDVPGTTDAFDRLVQNWSGNTDSYVKLCFLSVAYTYPEPLDIEQVRQSMPAEAWPILRTYSIRHLDPVAREVWIDFVIHGDSGIAGPWAAQAEAGQTIYLLGPGGAYRPDPQADHQLFVGDESALPAIAASVEAMTAGGRATIFCEVADDSEEQDLRSAAELDVRWLHRGSAEPGTTSLLFDAVREWDWPAGRVQAFIHGESALLSTVRPFVLNERGVERADVSISAYWRYGATEESFREWKSQQAEPIMDPQR